MSEQTWEHPVRTHGILDVRTEQISEHILERHAECMPEHIDNTYQKNCGRTCQTNGETDVRIDAGTHIGALDLSDVMLEQMPE